MSLLCKCTYQAIDPDCDADRCIYRCGCGLHHRLVECGGIYHCPNPLCRSCGADWFRSGRSSYKADKNGRTSVDMTELVEDGLHLALDGIQDPAIREATFRSALRWIREYRLDSEGLSVLVSRIPMEKS